MESKRRGERGEEGSRVPDLMSPLLHLPYTWKNISVLQALQNSKRPHRAQTLSGRGFHQVEAGAEKALSLVEDSWSSFRPGITNKFLPPESPPHLLALDAGNPHYATALEVGDPWYTSPCCFLWREPGDDPSGAIRLPAFF